MPPGTRYTPRDQVHPPGPGAPPGPGTLPPGPGTPQTRYIPQTRSTPLDQVHPPRPGTPPRTRYTPWDQVPPRIRYTPGSGTPLPQTRYTPRTRYTPTPRYGHCCGRYASYWNAFLFIFEFEVFVISNSERSVRADKSKYKNSPLLVTSISWTYLDAYSIKSQLL